MRIRRIFVAFVCVGLFSGGGLWAAEKYRAKLFTRGGPNTESVVRLEINVDSYTKGEEGWLMFHALNYEGWDPFITAFRRAKKGNILFHGARGLNITVHAARVIPREDGGRQILLFTEKQGWEVDVMQRMDGRFPFMVFELDLDNKGAGEGKIYENAQIKLQGDRETGTGVFEMESYNSAPKVLFNVNLVK
jgi:hypothetical protein